MDFSDPRSLSWVSYNPRRPWPSSPLSVGEAANKHNLRSIAPTPFGAALRNKITLTDGVVDQANFDTYEPLRLSDMPAVDVHIGKSDRPPRRTWRSSHCSRGFECDLRRDWQGAPFTTVRVRTLEKRRKILIAQTNGAEPSIHGTPRPLRKGRLRRPSHRREQGSGRSRGAEAAAVTGFLPQALANPTANATRD
jgi:hypothetical protein